MSKQFDSHQAEFDRAMKRVHSDKVYYRYGAVSALGRLGDRRAEEVLLKRLEDSHPRIKQEAVIALIKLDPDRDVEPLSKAVGYDETRVPERVRADLYKFKFGYSDGWSELHPAVKIFVCKLGELRSLRPTEVFIDGAKHGDARVRTVAALGLGRYGDARGVEVLISLLGDAAEPVPKVGSVSSIAAKALGRFKDERALDPLIKLYLHSENSKERRAARKALVRFGAIVREPLWQAAHNVSRSRRLRAWLLAFRLRG